MSQTPYQEVNKLTGFQLFMTATLGAVDKVAISTAAIYGLKDDLHLVGQQYSWAGSILFLGVGDASIGGLVSLNK
jgi:hypothetical protein